jgi:hypothetical protein
VICVPIGINSHLSRRSFSEGRTLNYQPVAITGSPADFFFLKFYFCFSTLFDRNQQEDKATG